MKTSVTSTPTRAPATPQSATRPPPPSQTQHGQVTPATGGRKRKLATPAQPPSGVEVVDLTGDSGPSTAKKPRSRGRRPQDESPQPERRARKWRNHPPQSYLTRLDRIRTQRFGYCLSWITKCADVSCAECLSLAILLAELTRLLRSCLISSGQPAICTRQSSGRSQPATVLMLQRVTSANTSAMVS